MTLRDFCVNLRESRADAIGKYGCNIANMTLSRDEKGGMALSVYELDALPAPEAVAELKALDKVEAVRVVDFS